MSLALTATFTFGTTERSTRALRLQTLKRTSQNLNARIGGFPTSRAVPLLAFTTASSGGVTDLLRTSLLVLAQVELPMAIIRPGTSARGFPAIVFDSLQTTGAGRTS